MNGNSDVLNRSYLDRLTIAYRFIGTVEATTECTIFGRRLKTPVMLGGMAHYEKLHPLGMTHYAQAALKAGTAMWTGFSGDQEIEDVIQVGIPAARIIKPSKNKDIIFRAMAHDEAAGAAAIAIDIDHAYNKQGRHDTFREEELAPPSVEDLRSYARNSALPLFAKGVLSVPDALACAEAGIAGIVVSQHQNMFPWCVPVLKVLPEIRRAVGNKLTILCDSGLDTGYDVFKALALGADAVFSVQPNIPIFQEKGADGVAERIEGMTAELRSCLSRTGSPDIAHIDPSVIQLL